MLSKIVMLVWTAFIGWSFFTGVGNIDTTGMSDEMLVWVTMISMVLHSIVWSAVAIPTAILSWMFGRRTGDN